MFLLLCLIGKGFSLDLFRIQGNKLTSLARVGPKLECEIQRLFEANLETVFGLRFLASEYSTGERQAGRIDTLGLDENGTPTILEYKLSSSINVINQALYYLDWLVDHRGDFELLVHKRLGKDVRVDWSAPRVLCVADSFALYDTYAVSQMGRAIQLAEYKLFADGLLLVSVVGSGQPQGRAAGSRQVLPPSVDEHLGRSKGPLREIAEELRQYLLDLGEDISESAVRGYIAYRTTRNFCCLEIHQEHLFLDLTLDPALGEGCAICQDVSNIGHFGTGDLRVKVTRAEDVPIAKRFIDLAYQRVSGLNATDERGLPAAEV